MITRTGVRRKRTTSSALALLVTIGLVAASCSDKKDDEAITTGTDEPVATEAGEEPAETTGEEPTEQTTLPPATVPPAPEVEVVYGGRLVVGGEAEVANPWTPAAMQCDSFCQMRARTVYDPLIVVNEALEVEPFLLESVEPNEDFTEFTLKVREGITFHDGTPLNADVVIDNLTRSGGGLLIRAAVKDLAFDAEGKLVTEKVDDMTLKLFTGLNGNLAEPISWPLFPYSLGGQFGLIASSEWLAAVDADPSLASQPVGSGPFLYSSYAPGDKFVVTRNPDYWGTDADGNQLPFLDEIEFRVIVDSQVRAEALRSGDVDLISTSDSAVVKELSEDSEFGYLNQDQYGETNYILMHVGKEGSPLADKRVRCGMLQAFDKQELIDLVAAGFPEVANGPFSPGQEGHLDDNGSLPFDVDAAAAQIAEYEAEVGPVSIIYSTTPTQTNLTTAQYLQGVWSAIGIDVEIAQIEQSTLINNALFGDPAFDAFGWRNHAGLFADGQYFWWHSSAAPPTGQLALNFGRLRDPEIDRLLELSRSEADPDVRRGYAEDINRRFASECWIIPTSFTKWGVHFDQKVQNIGRSPIPGKDTFMRDGAGFPGQVWLTAVYVTE